MFNLLCDAIFGFSWDRFTKPAVIIGIVIMILGMILLIAANKISHFIIKLGESKDKKLKDTTLIFKILAGVIVLIGALLTILTA